MAERYKALGAMLALQEFDAKELASFSDVKIATIRTILARERQFIEPIGYQAGSGPGGRYKRYRVRPDRIDRLRAEIDRLFPDALRVPDNPAQPHPETMTEPDAEIPLGLLAAEDAVLRLYPGLTKQQEQLEFLDVARLNLQSARVDLETLEAGNDTPPAVLQRWQTHLYFVEAIINVCTDCALRTDTGRFLQSWNRLSDALDQLARLTRYDHTETVVSRFFHSPFMKAIGELLADPRRTLSQQKMAVYIAHPATARSARCAELIQSVENLIREHCTANSSVYRQFLNQVGLEIELIHSQGLEDSNLRIFPVDSSDPQENLLKLPEAIIAPPGNGVSSVVLDVDFNPEIRNQLMGRGNHYVGHSLTLDDKALWSTLTDSFFASLRRGGRAADIPTPPLAVA